MEWHFQLSAPEMWQSNECKVFTCSHFSITMELKSKTALLQIVMDPWRICNFYTYKCHASGSLVSLSTAVVFLGAPPLGQTPCDIHHQSS